MECFVIIAKGWKPLTFITKRSILAIYSFNLKFVKKTIKLAIIR